jgi:16S rRNA (guanine(966)-N(2))-methyltransferase RsmD
MRVVAGQFRGRRLHTLARGRNTDTRPTTERAREGLFGWLGPQVEGVLVLDLFAGTGALGIEAISRGAGGATFVESARQALAVLSRNLESLGLLDLTQVLAQDVRGGLSTLRRKGARFGLILADPPYLRPPQRDWSRWLVRDAGLEDLLADRGVLIVERPTESLAPEGGGPIELRGSKSYGGTSFDWYQRKGEVGE